MIFMSRIKYIIVNAFINTNMILLLVNFSYCLITKILYLFHLLLLINNYLLPNKTQIYII